MEIYKEKIIKDLINCLILAIGQGDHDLIRSLTNLIDEIKAKSNDKKDKTEHSNNNTGYTG